MLFPPPANATGVPGSVTDTQAPPTQTPGTMASMWEGVACLSTFYYFSCPVKEVSVQAIWHHLVSERSKVLVSLEDLLLSKWNQMEDRQYRRTPLSRPQQSSNPRDSRVETDRSCRRHGEAAEQRFCKGESGETVCKGLEGWASRAAEDTPVVCRSHGEHTMYILPQL